MGHTPDGQQDDQPRPRGRPAPDVAGRRFGRLVVLGRTEERSRYGGLLWRCRCDCGTLAVVEGSDLRSGERADCGRRCPLRPSQRWPAVARRRRAEGKTLAEIAAAVGVSKQRVHQVLGGGRNSRLG